MAIDPVFEKYCQDRSSANHFLIAVDPLALAGINPVLGPAADGFQLWTQRFKAHFPKISKVCTGLLAKESFGAAADILNDTAVVMINASVPTILSNLMIMFLSHPNASEKAHPSIIQMDIRGISVEEEKLLSFLYNNGSLLSAPPLIVNRALALASTLCNFIFFHEFVHIRNGHVDLFHEKIGLFAMEETESQFSPELLPLDRRTMEWDADKVAHILSSDVALSTILGRPFIECPKDQVVEAYRLYHLALYLMFKIMELMEKNQNVTEKSHPASVARVGFLLVQLDQLAGSLKIDSLPENFSIDITRSGEIAWALITRKPMADMTARADKMQEQMSDMFSILRNWNILRERLAPYNRGDTELGRPNLD